MGNVTGRRDKLRRQLGSGILTSRSMGKAYDICILKRPRDVELAVQQQLRLDAKLAVIAQLSDVVIAALPKLEQPFAPLLSARTGAGLAFGE